MSIKPNEIKKAVADCLGVSEDALKNNPRVKRLGELLIIKGYSNGIYNNAQDVQKVMNILDIKQLKALDNEDTQSMLRFFDCDNNINNS